MIVLALLAACAPVPTPAPTAMPTATFTPQPTVTPTHTPEPQPTHTAKVEIPLEQLPATIAAATEFANAMTAAGTPITSEQVLQQGLAIKEISGQDGRKYEVASTQDGYPLMIKSEGGEWEEVTFSKLVNNGKLNNLDVPFVFGGMVEKYPETESIYKQFNGGLLASVWGWTTMKNGVDSDIDYSYENFQTKYAQQFNYPKNNAIFNALIWGSNTPKGVETFSREQGIAWMEKYIDTIMIKYQDTFGIYIVVNEPRSDDLLMQVIGSDYVEIAYKAARKANPEARLVYNQTDNHGPEGKYVADTESIGNKLYEEGLIDAIGVQGHLVYGSEKNAPTEEQILETLNRYNAPIILTEVDANMQFLNVTEEKKLEIQSQWYSRLLNACLKSDKCLGLYLFGAFPDKNSWYVLSQNQPKAESTPWDNDFRPKKAVYEMEKALFQYALSQNQ